MAEIPELKGGDIEIGRRIAFEMGQHSQDKAIALLVAQVEALQDSFTRLLALINDMGCANEWYIEDCPKALPNNRDEWCVVCRAKQAAAQMLDK